MKTIAKNLIVSALSELNYSVLINSYGRSGSTMLTQSVINDYPCNNNKYLGYFLRRAIPQTAWNLNSAAIQNGFIYKTHDYPPDQKFDNKVRIIYIYSNPVDVVLSLIRLYDERGEEWMKEHFDHLKAPYKSFENIIDQDLLCLERHFDHWLEEKRFPIAFVRYEALWNHQKDLSEFLGFPINLPLYRERTSKQENDKNIISKLEKTYSTLKKKILNCDSYFTNNNG